MGQITVTNGCGLHRWRDVLPLLASRLECGWLRPFQVDYLVLLRAKARK